MNKGLALAVLGAGAVALAAIGCGDDSSGDDFAAEVGAICEDVQQQFADANAGLVLRDAGYVEDFRDANRPVYDDYIAKLEEVEPPADEEQAYDAYVVAIRRRSEALLANPLGPIRAGLAGKETAFTRKLEQLKADAVSSGQEAGIPAACTTGTSEGQEATQPGG